MQKYRGFAENPKEHRLRRPRFHSLAAPNRIALALIAAHGSTCASVAHPTEAARALSAFVP